MKQELPNIDSFERKVFWKKNALKLLLSFSLKLLKARQVGLIYGSDNTNVSFLRPEKWDRGIVHKFNGNGWLGFGLKCLGRQYLRFKGLSPIRLYKNNQYGERVDRDGIIAFVLRKHKDFYKNGIKIFMLS